MASLLLGCRILDLGFRVGGTMALWILFYMKIILLKKRYSRRMMGSGLQFAGDAGLYLGLFKSVSCCEQG